MSQVIGWLGTYAYDTTKGRTELIEGHLKAGVPVILDSGAFTAFTSGRQFDVVEHAQWVKGWQQRERHGTSLLCLALDVIGDSEATYRNWLTQVELGADVVPTLHFGDDPKLVDRYLDAVQWIAVGGLVPYYGRFPRQVEAWSAAVIGRAHRKGVKVHGLGMVVPKLHWSLPFDGCDSTYWLMASRFGQHALFDPKIRDWRKIKTCSGSAFRYRGLIADCYLTTPEKIDADTRGGESRQFAEAIAVKSHTLFADTFRARHGSELVVYLAGGNPPVR